MPKVWSSSLLARAEPVVGREGYTAIGRRTAMRLSAKNILKGKVKSIIPGAVNSEVVIELDGGTLITSIITKESASALGLTVGGTAYAVIKASSVMVGVD
jgi:molybdopterin-binding protein